MWRCFIMKVLRNGSPFQSFRFKTVRIERITSIVVSRKFSV